MNRIYKLKFDKRRNEVVVVSEITTGPGKVRAARRKHKKAKKQHGILSRSLLSLLVLAGLGDAAYAAPALPTGGQVVAGSATIHTPSADRMNINQSSHNAVVNWNSFDIAQGHTVQFYQPDSSAVALNRVVGGNESRIMGNLNANGRVFLVNPNGVLFGKGASVNTAGLVATTRDIKNEDFMEGKFAFSGQKGNGEVVNQGTLTTTKGGFIVLAGDRVKNSGTLRAPAGRAVLAAAESVTLQLDNAGLTSVNVNGSVVNALVENSGLVSSSDGQVWLTARGKEMLMNTVLNNSGVVEASGLSQKDGNIVLDGGESGVVHHSGTLLADNQAGQGGRVVVQGENILLDKGSHISATGSQGGGEVMIGGGWQGKDPAIRHAKKTVMLKGADIDVSATTKGNGGTAVLWSDEYTNFEGDIRAKGGRTSGNGGRVETSSHNNLQAFGRVDASSPAGRGGEWLLDPADITIVSDSQNTNVSDSGSNPAHVFTPNSGVTSGQVGVENINNQLNNGTSVNITTNNSAGAGNGDITVNANISKTGGGNASLTLLADRNITVNKNITSTTGELNVSLLAGNTSQNANITIGTNVNITTNNGSLTAKAANASHNVGVYAYASGMNLNAGAGDINLTGSSVFLDGMGNGAKGASVTAGNFTLNATSLGSEISNITIKVQDNITLKAKANNGHSGVYLENANLTSISGSITGQGNTTSGGRAVRLYGNVVMTASHGNITLIGNASNAAGIVTDGSSSFDSTHLNMTGTTKSGSGFSLGNVTMNGRLSDWSNVTLSSAGSASGTMNYINGTGINSTDALKNVIKKGIENGTIINVSGITGNSSVVNTTSHSLNLTGLMGILELGSHQGDDFNLNLTGSKGGGWGFSNGVDKLEANGSITLSGLLTPGSMSSHSGNISVDTGNSTMSLVNVNLSAAHNITLNGSIIQLNGTGMTWSAMEDINLNGSRVNIDSANVTFSNGNVNINATAPDGYGVFIQNASLTATNGNISVTGTIKSGSKGTYDNGGVVIAGNNIFSAKNTNITGNGVGNYGVALQGASAPTGIDAHGNLSINGVGESGAVGVGILYRDVNINMTSGLLNISGTSDGNAGVYFRVVIGQWASNKLNVTLNNSNFTMNGCGSWGGISGASSAASYNSGVIVRGVGNVTIKGNSTGGGPGAALHYLDNQNLTGSLEVDGQSESGDGVVTSLNSGWLLKNAVIIGESKTGNGIVVSSNQGVALSPRIDLGNTTLSGKTVNGSSGVSIAGKDVTLTNGVITGTATSQNGAGVSLSGGSNYTVSGATVSGTSANGAGISVNGTLEVGNNASLRGTSTGTGSGVNIDGDLASTGGAIITGTASSGDGVQISGNLKASGGDFNIIGASGTGNGVTVSGDDTTVDNVNVTGITETGSGVSIAGNLTSKGDSAITGTASNGGMGVDLSGNVTSTAETSISGTSSKGGTGVNLHGEVSGGSITGS
ncbi:filamentous hemagglutinin N-terminal domain-containing protein, partial [Escherichia coli]|nr:filamentous hemagglutinin N-terminal domain-containing protein [Escherichia coli]